MGVLIRGLAYHLPEKQLTNAELTALYPKWTDEKIRQKTGIRTRRIADATEFTSDLAVAAAEKLLAQGNIDRRDVDFILLCTQSPDYLLPTTACLVQDRLGLRSTCGALDINLGCSGYVYGLGMATGLIESGQARNILLLTAETYSKYLHVEDINVRSIFGDGAAATLLSRKEGRSSVGPFVYGTDGRGAQNLILRQSGLRREETSPGYRLYMNGPEIFSFTLEAVPPLVEQILTRAGLAKEDVDWFVFHQANTYMLNRLREKIEIPEEKFWISMEDCGNTVSATIPIALCHMLEKESLCTGQNVVLVGFGVGYSWGATVIRWE